METILCPQDNMEMKLVKKTDSMKFRGVDISFASEAYVCPVCGLETATIEQASSIQKNISDAYRKTVGLITGAEIREKRKQSNLSQEDLAERMKVGVASIKRWEGSQIQTKSMDTALRTALRDCYCGDKYTGNKELSIPRIKLVLKQFEEDLHRTVLKQGDRLLYAAKYLWYADMVSFRERGESITGASYAKLPQGPQLNNYKDLVVFIIDADESQAEPLIPEEARIIQRVAMTFPLNRDVYHAAHKEIVWEEKSVGNLIPYTDANRLTQI